MRRNLTFDVVYPYPPELLWKALTDSEALSQWLMKNDFEPRVGHKFQFHTDPAPGFDGTIDCEVLEVDEPRRLVFTWKGGPIDTVVTFQLERVDEGTRLRLEHSGFKGPRAIMVSMILGKGWKKKILRKNLPRALAQMRPKEREVP